MSWFFLMRARVRLAWAIFTGRISVRVDESAGVVLTKLILDTAEKREKELEQLYEVVRRQNDTIADQGREIARLQRANPYR